MKFHNSFARELSLHGLLSDSSCGCLSTSIHKIIASSNRKIANIEIAIMKRSKLCDCRSLTTTGASCSLFHGAFLLEVSNSQIPRQEKMSSQRLKREFNIHQKQAPIKPDIDLLFSIIYHQNVSLILLLSSGLKTASSNFIPPLSSRPENAVTWANASLDSRLEFR